MENKTIQSANPRQRVALYDNVKFLMITLVVVGHFADFYTNEISAYRSIFLFIYTFHMPVLFFISGLFYSANRTRQKILFYVCSGFALKILSSITGMVFFQKWSFSLLSDSGIPWFMFVLAAFQLLMYFLKDADKRFLLVFCVILACFVGYDKSVGSFLYLSRTVVFFPFYLLGTMITQEKMTAFREKYSKKLFLVAFIVVAAWLFLCFYEQETFYGLRTMFSGKNPFSDKYGPLRRLFCYAITSLVGGGLLFLVPNVKIPFITNWGAKTLNVYFWHWAVYRLLDHYFHIGKIYSFGVAGAVGFLLLGVVMTMLLSEIKLFDYPLKTIKTFCFKTAEKQR